MDTTTTRVADRRSYRSLILIAIALTIVLSMAAVVNATTHHGLTGGQELTTTVTPIVAPKTDPAARIHLQIAAGLAKRASL